jgi:indole-3-glycerol phosphate synthase
MSSEPATTAGAPATPTVLAQILQSTRAELERRRQVLPERELAAQVERARAAAAPAGDSDGVVAARGARRGFDEAVRAPGIGVIAEFKRRSPSAGALREHAEIDQIVAAYERGGACALSVLTEEAHFAGSLEDLRSACRASSLPVLRKDFVVDRYQLYEASAAGADAVLLIVAALDADQLRALLAGAHALGLDALVEVHDERELHTALEAGARLLGVNNRDLRDFSVDVERTYVLLSGMPEDAIVVSESGIGTRAQLARLQDVGVAAVLVGESLMRAGDPEQALRDLRPAGDREQALRELRPE